MNVEILLSFYDVSVRVTTGSGELQGRVLNDFSFFKCEKVLDKKPDIQIEATLKEINIDSYKSEFGRERFIFRKTKTFDLKKRRLNIYDNKLVSIYDFENEEGKIIGGDINLLHEILYLLILSRVGKLHDLMGIHRLHAMFAQKDDLAIVGIGASGAGKSTLLLNLCKEGASFGSDDITLITKSGDILPFPIRAGSSTEIPGLECHFTLMRREYGEKFLYNLSKIYKVSPKVSKAQFLLLERGRGLLSKASTVKKIIFLIKYLIIGFGTPQIFEYFWECGLVDFVKKTRILISRIICTANILKTNNFYCLRSQSEAESMELLSKLTTNNQ